MKNKKAMAVEELLRTIVWIVVFGLLLFGVTVLIMRLTG
jgi:hypothetical protein